MNGFVDVQGRRIHGWAFDQQTNWPASVDIYVDGVKAGSAVADQHRAGSHGRDAGRALRVRVLSSGRTDGRHAAHGRGAPAWRFRSAQYGAFKFQFPSPDYVAGLAQWIMRLGWWVLGCAIEDDVVEIGGWFVSPLGGEEGRISVNGQSIVITTTEQREEWTAHFAPNLVVRNFSGRFPLEREWNDLRFSLGLERPFRRSRTSIIRCFRWRCPTRRAACACMATLRKPRSTSRAIRPRSSSTRLARRFAGRPLAELGPVLDWGCGCGRTAQFLERDKVDLFGIDIDADNVAWCAENLTGRYSGDLARSADGVRRRLLRCDLRHLGLHHLDQRIRGALARPSCIGSRARAPCFCSRCSAEHRSARAGLLDRVVSHQAAIGFTDAGRNADIDAVTQGSEYYRNVFHLPRLCAQASGGSTSRSCRSRRRSSATRRIWSSRASRWTERSGARCRHWRLRHSCNPGPLDTWIGCGPDRRWRDRPS